MLWMIPSAAADSVAVLRAEGCLACHSAGADAGIGPPLGTLTGHEVTVLQDGARRTLKVDADYVTRAMIAPDLEVVEGYPAGRMPAVDPQRAAELLPHLAALRPDSAKPRVPVAWAVGAAALFTVSHLVLSARKLRDPMRRMLGIGPFIAVYSALITGPFVALVWTWSRAAYTPLWLAPTWARHLPLGLMPLVCIAFVGGVSTPSPTLLGREGRLRELAEPFGIYRVTRHPLAIGTAVWAMLHVAPNGDLATVSLLGSVGIVGLVGALHLDRRLAAEHGDDWRRYAAQTSVVPFAAILTGRTRFVPGEIGVLRALGGLVLYALLLSLHTWLVGASPFPR